MKNKDNYNFKNLAGRIGFTFLGAILALLLIFFVNSNPAGFRLIHEAEMGHYMSMDTKREIYLGMRNNIQDTLRDKGAYMCCIEKSCSYCIDENIKHGRGASCECITDVVNGNHPCGECIGEILEGHGNPYLAKYFARAIAEEVGQDYIVFLRDVISDKYNLPADKQL